eukprot:TRINITY_DN5763_c0_g1_i1.p1 TRINITY_DN5763_c0_g1~~TRINITY_DN5763_c0_g1_i1.p1  ORF type:complete len:497 (-),score=87.30 TRINITY_DN5763_c0_g1_i1:88-1578(-)
MMQPMPTPNIIHVPMGGLAQDVSQTKDSEPLRCEECNACLSMYSTIDDVTWSCEFCSTENTIALDSEQQPTQEVVEYILTPGIKQDTEKKNEKKNEDNSMVILCLDNSGSMGNSVNTKEPVNFPSTIPHNKTSPTRMQCIQAAVHHQLEAMAAQFPNQRPVVITFCTTVRVYFGNGSCETINGNGNNFSVYFNKGQKFADMELTLPASKAVASLIKCVDGLSPESSTALGPAVSVGIGIASRHPGSKIMVCTDGMANAGLNTKKDYETMCQAAKNASAQVSILSLQGCKCNMETIGKLASETGGTVDVVDPVQINKAFSSLVSQAILGTGLEITVRVDDRLQFLGNETSSILAEIGTATSNTDLTFSFEAKEYFEAEKIPIQSEVSYSRPDGAKCIRVTTCQVPITHDRDEAEGKLNSAVMALDSLRTAAAKGEEEDYKKARMLMISTQRLLQRAMNSKSHQQCYIKFIKQAERLDGFMRISQQQQQLLGTGRKKR